MKTLVLGAALSCVAGLAHAQVLTIASSNPGGLTHSIGSAIAKTVTENSDLSVVVVPAGGSPNPAVAGGEADCGVNVGFDVAYYAQAKAFYEGQSTHDNLRMVASVLDSQVALYVNKDSELETISDLKGKRVPGGLNAQLAIGKVYDTYLELAGLGRDDVASIPAQSIVQAADDFSAGRNDTFLFSVGSAKVLEVDSSVGGLKALQVDATDANRKLLDENLPGARFVELAPESSPQITVPTNVIAYDLVLFCSDGTAPESIATIARIVHDHKAELAESFKPLNRLDPAAMAPAISGLEYHTGASDYYKSINLME